MRFTLALFTSSAKTLEPEAEVFCSTALRALLLLHEKVDKSEISGTTPDRKQGLSQRVNQSKTQLKNGSVKHSPKLWRFLQRQESCRKPVLSTGRELLTLTQLSSFLAGRLQQSRKSRSEGVPLSTAEVLGRKYLDHIEACVVQNSAERQFEMRARNVELDPCFQLFPFITHTPVTSAETLAIMICRLIERDIPFRRIWPQIETMYNQTAGIRGIRVACAGRTSRKATKAKTLNARAGSTSLAVFDRDVDFATATADTRHGSIGIKRKRSDEKSYVEVDEPRRLLLKPIKRREDFRRCLRCGVGNSEAVGACRFHPYLLEDPGPLKYTPQWLRCKNAGHSKEMPGCYVRFCPQFVCNRQKKFAMHKM